MKISATGNLEMQGLQAQAQAQAALEQTTGRQSLSRRSQHTEKLFGTGDIFRMACDRCATQEKTSRRRSVQDPTRALQRCYALASSMGASCPVALTTEVRRRAAQRGKCFHPGIRPSTGEMEFKSIAGVGRRRSYTLKNGLFPCIVQLLDSCSNSPLHGADTGATDAACVHRVIGECTGVCPGFRDVVRQASGRCPGGVISGSSLYQNQSTRGISGSSTIEQRARSTRSAMKSSLDEGLHGKCSQ